LEECRKLGGIFFEVVLQDRDVNLLLLLLTL